MQQANKVILGIVWDHLACRHRQLLRERLRMRGSCRLRLSLHGRGHQRDALVTEASNGIRQNAVQVSSADSGMRLFQHRFHNWQASWIADTRRE